MKEQALKVDDGEIEEEEEEEETTLIGLALEEAMGQLTPLNERQTALREKLEAIRDGDSDDLLQKRLMFLAENLRRPRSWVSRK